VSDIERGQWRPLAAAPAASAPNSTRLRRAAGRAKWMRLQWELHLRVGLARGRGPCGQPRAGRLEAQAAPRAAIAWSRPRKCPELSRPVVVNAETKAISCSSSNDVCHDNCGLGSRATGIRRCSSSRANNAEVPRSGRREFRQVETDTGGGRLLAFVFQRACASLSRLSVHRSRTLVVARTCECPPLCLEARKRELPPAFPPPIHLAEPELNLAPLWAPRTELARFGCDLFVACRACFAQQPRRRQCCN